MFEPLIGDITPFHLLLANLALLAGACLQGVAGYGIGTLSAPLMFMISPRFLPAVMILNAFVLNILMLVRNRQGVSVKPVRYAVSGAFGGTALAAITLTMLSPEGFKLAFGVLILMAIALSVVGVQPRLTARNSLIAGTVSGYMGTITAVGGPPIALIYQKENPVMVRGNLAAFFIFSCIAAMIALANAGLIGREELILVALTCPGMIFGFWLSGHIVTRLPWGALRPIILSVAAASGITAIVSGVWDIYIAD